MIAWEYEFQSEFNCRNVIVCLTGTDQHLNERSSEMEKGPWNIFCLLQWI